MLFIDSFDPFSSVMVITMTRLSVLEIELLVELSIAFDFCSSYCFIFIIFFVGLFRLQKYAGVFNSHCTVTGEA